MTSEAKRAANRANARKSTGPRSEDGKARASQNARRHGLGSPAAADPASQDAIKALTVMLAGEGASPALQAQAAVVAEAQVDLRRARAARAHLQQVWIEALERLRSTPVIPPGEEIAAVDRQYGTDTASLIAYYEDTLSEAGRQKHLPGIFAAAAALAGLPRQRALQHVAETARDLARIDRYERRALSRRRTAVKHLDELRAAEAAP
jgi:hypothetical protein